MPLDLTEADEFTGPITVPEAGDDRTAASIVPAFQALANRVHYLKQRAGIGPAGDTHEWTDKHSFAESVGLIGDVRMMGAANEIEYADPIGIAAPRPRASKVNLYGGLGAGAPGLGLGLPNGSVDFAAGAQGIRSYPIDLPSGATITGFTAEVYNGTGSDSGLSIGIYRLTSAGVVEGIVDSTGPVGLANSASAALGETGSIVVDNATGTYLAHVTAFDGGTVRDITINWLDPGPRNG